MNLCLGWLVTVLVVLARAIVNQEEARVTTALRHFQVTTASVCPAVTATHRGIHSGTDHGAPEHWKSTNLG